MTQRKKSDEDGPRIHRMEVKDTFKKHRKSVYDLVDDEDDEDDDFIPDYDKDDEDI